MFLNMFLWIYMLRIVNYKARIDSDLSLFLVDFFLRYVADGERPDMEQALSKSCDSFANYFEGSSAHCAFGIRDHRMPIIPHFGFPIAKNFIGKLNSLPLFPYIIHTVTKR